MDQRSHIEETVGRRSVACLGRDQLDQLSAMREAGSLVWLNLSAAESAEIATAGSALELHPLTIEDMQQFDQRAKLEQYENYVQIVAFGAGVEAGDDDGLVEIHLIFDEDFLVTLTRDEHPDLARLQAQLAGRELSALELLHRVLGTIIDSFGPALDIVDAEVERLEEQIVRGELAGRALEIHQLRRRAARLARAVHRQLEAFTGLAELLRELPGERRREIPYFRDLQDRLTHLAESADAVRESTTSLFELQMAALDNRQNIVMRQFTVIAGIFLPLSVVTGFFGMNFGWMVRQINGAGDFLLLGVALPLLILTALVVVFVRRGLLRE